MTVGAAVTETVVCAFPPQVPVTVYVSVFDPTKPDDGVKTPPVVTPEPDQVPPAGVPFNVRLVPLEQADCDEPAETVMVEETVTLRVAPFEQPLDVTVYVKEFEPRLADAGVKVPVGETPVPDQVPPAGENPVRVKGAFPEQVETLVPATTDGFAFTVTTN